ncbi:helix-turn-helix domain-containing protein [Bacteriovorax sp. DB6_IX]|uniref:helix-turn-helix domain-containing protein n=1 Tax=Bacteriovorax sp. DB6_IX TaxID=1353530 RepID=UPI00038A29F7|nr:helix-turn-helix domain-containing protein [Bacteriovorax sp. DB6_IX]EQC52535.1 DNA-binding helix-turn-helix protein [Bacteriovorax sp. DB6_IX]
MYRADLSRIIKARRRELGLSQIDMATQLEINYRHYQDIETGKINLKLDTFVKIIEKLDLHVCLHNNRIYERTSPNLSLEIEHLGKIASELEVGLTLINKDTTYFYINDFLAQINGIPAENYTGKTLYDIVPDFAVNLEKAIDCCLSLKEIRFFEATGMIPRDLFETSYKIAVIPYTKEKALILVKDITLHKTVYRHFKDLAANLDLHISIPSMRNPLKKIDRDAAIGNFNFLKSLLIKFADNHAR